MQEIEINGFKINPQHYIDKWTNWALEATPATDEQVINNVKALYKKANLAEPKVLVYRDYEKFISIDWDSVGASVGASVRASVRASVGSSVWASVRASVGASVGASVWASVGASVGSYAWADDMSFADVFVDTKVLTQEKADELKEYKELLETQRFAVLLSDVAYVLVAPTIRREDGRLHNDQRPAVEWENGTGQYYLDGVNFPKDLWSKVVSKEMSLSEIMQIEISDQRTVALKYNPQAIIKEKAKLIHKDDRTNELYLVENSEINTLTNFPRMYFVKMTCPTGRVFIEGVPPEIAEQTLNATDCQAWLCGLVKSDYQSMVMES